MEGYQELVGSILYMLHTRPELAYAAKEAARHMQFQEERHWQAAKRILCYAKGTIDEAITLTGAASPRDLVMVGYVDAAHATNPDTKRSTTGLIFALGSSAFYWRSCSQTAVAGSSTEAELVGIREALLEVRFLRRVLHQFAVPQSAPTIIWTDSQGGIDNVVNEKWQGRTRYMDIYARQANEIISQQHRRDPPPLVPASTCQQTCSPSTCPSACSMPSQPLSGRQASARPTTWPPSST